jgi:penicillin-binding protein 2
MIRTRPTSAIPRARLRLLAIVLGVGFLVVGGQLAYLQILSGERLAALSDRNRLRLRPIAAPRGILFDRAGLSLADNRPAFSLVVVPRDVPDLGALVDRLAGLLQTPASELRDRLARVSADSPWPVRLSRGLTLEEVSATSARHRTRISGGATSAGATSSARPGSSAFTTSTSEGETGASRSRSTPMGA